MLSLVPISLKAANSFVAEHHRHHKPTRGHKFSIGCEAEGQLVGVAIVGRPVSRYLDDGRTLEVNRLCTTGEQNACSMLYAAAALLESPSPLADVFKDFRDMETGHMDHIRECVEDRAENLLEAKREATHSIPLYWQSGEYAVQHGELDAFRASLETNIACRDAIEAAIEEGFDGMCLHADTKDVLSAFGAERVSHVLAATLQGIRNDPRISSSNQAWAATVPMFDTVSRHRDYLITSHPGVLSIFVTQTRKEMDAMQKQAEKKPSIKAQLAAKPDPGDQPSKPKDREAR